jgi:hypothetical protein
MMVTTDKPKKGKYLVKMWKQYWTVDNERIENGAATK